MESSGETLAVLVKIEPNSNPVVSSSSPTQSGLKDKFKASQDGPPKTCRVCGDSALNMNFGAVSCESCKAFFRRNALRNKEFKCPFQSNCQIDLESRRWCQQCRLRKCFDVGMKKELIQKGKRPLDEVGSDPDSPLDRKPSSPGLVNCTPAPRAKRVRKVKTPRVSVMKNVTANGGAAVIAIETVVEPEKNLAAAMAEVCSPTPSAESSLSMESNTACGLQGCGLELLAPFEREKINELIRANEVMNESNPDEELAAVRYRERQGLVDVINMTDIAIRRLIKMTKKIAEFRNLLQEDQIALLKGACFEMMILRAVSHYNVEKDCWQGPQATMISVDVLKEARAESVNLASYSVASDAETARTRSSNASRSVSKNSVQLRLFPRTAKKRWRATSSGNCYEEIRTFIHSFALEFRKDEPLLLILGAITLFHPDRPSLEHRGQIRAQQSLYYFLLHSYLRAKYYRNTQQETEALYMQMTTRIDLLHLLNDRHITMFLDLNPEHVEPLLIEIFDLKLPRPVKP